jgi:hypothetical protein
MVEETVSGSRVTYAKGGARDSRCYRVDCTKLARRLHNFQPQWTVRRGIEELHLAYKRHGLTLEEFTSSRFLRIKRVQELMSEHLLDSTLRWRCSVETRGGRSA